MGLLISIGDPLAKNRLVVFARVRHASNRIDSWNVVGLRIETPPETISSVPWSEWLRRAQHHQARDAA